MEHSDGRGPKGVLPKNEVLQGKTNDPAVGDVLQFRIVDRVESVDSPGGYHYANDIDRSRVPGVLTEQIPIVVPVRERVIEWKGADGPADELTGPCVPDCGPKESFGWTMKVNDGSEHFLNANRISMLVPKPGEVEHWTLVNGGGGWDHPVHLHLEEGVTINRGNRAVTALEKNARKDVWRLKPNGRVRIQVRFGEFGGAFVTHCHNTVHEDSAMLMRFDVQTDPNDPNQSQYHVTVAPTPHPTPEGVYFTTPEILPEGNPFAKGFKPFPKVTG
jgi:FtsP/CotA-like multicopper oxidase with cupredoxin domain